MISEDDYENYLLPFDQSGAKKRPFGIHYCGPDPHRMASSFAKFRISIFWMWVGVAT
jgi:hypothetical protein